MFVLTCVWSQQCSSWPRPQSWGLIVRVLNGLALGTVHRQSQLLKEQHSTTEVILSRNICLAGEIAMLRCILDTIRVSPSKLYTSDSTANFSVWKYSMWYVCVAVNTLFYIIMAAFLHHGLIQLQWQKYHITQQVGDVWIFNGNSEDEDHLWLELSDSTTSAIVINSDQIVAIAIVSW